MITIFVNGEGRKVAASTNLLELLTQLDLGNRRIAVELNQEIISRSSFASTFLYNDDRVEIVHAIGGG
jgi:thiamine biosynthesis protein ThiS